MDRVRGACRRRGETPRCRWRSLPLVWTLGGVGLLGAGEDRGSGRPPDREPLGSEEVERRTAALGSWVSEPVELQGDSYRIRVSRQDGRFAFEDLRTGTRWLSRWGQRGFASVLLEGDEAEWVAIDSYSGFRADDQVLRFRGASSRRPLPEIRFELRTLPAGTGVSLRYELGDPEPGAARIARIRLLDRALWVSDSEDGWAAIPGSPGSLAVSRGGPPPRLPQPPALRAAGAIRFLALSKSSNTVMATWTDPTCLATVSREPVRDDAFPGRSGLFATIESSSRAASVDLYTLGLERQPVTEAAWSYFALQRVGGSPISSLRQKTADPRERRSFLGSALFRPTLGEAWSSQRLEEYGQHLRDALGIDQAAFVLRGWEREGGEECLKGLRSLGYLAGVEIDASAWREGDERVAVEDLQDTLEPDLVWVRGLPDPSSGVETSVALERRSRVGRELAEAFGLVGIVGGLEVDVGAASFLEGLLDPVLDNAAGEAFYPLFTAAYGHAVRVGVSASRAIRPDQPEAVLAHLLLGEVPTYALPEGPEPGAEERATEARWCFARADGWAGGNGVSAHDAFLRNTYEVLSHVARQRFRERLLLHRALVPDGSVRESYFGQDLHVVVNFGPGEYRSPDGSFVLPPLGFLVRHPYLLAFHATRVLDEDYGAPAFFVVRSLEGKMYLRAERVLLYRGFGPRALRIAGRTFQVDTLAVVRIW